VAAGLLAVGSLEMVRAECNQECLKGRAIAVGIPGVSAISPGGALLPGGPIHDDLSLATYTQPGQILDPVRILVGSRSNVSARAGRWTGTIHPSYWRARPVGPSGPCGFGRIGGFCAARPWPS
jgi:hypothetical protein